MHGPVRRSVLLLPNRTNSNLCHYRSYACGFVNATKVVEREASGDRGRSESRHRRTSAVHPDFSE
jgi:hypothetical protein